MPVPIWAGRYIGLPFTEHGRDRGGIDCWGLARLVLLEQFDISLPSLAHEYRRTADVSRIAGLMEREIPRWSCITAGQEKCGAQARLPPAPIKSASARIPAPAG